MGDNAGPFEWALAGLLALAKAVLAVLWHSHDRLRDKVSALETKAAERYATKDELAEAISSKNVHLQSIEDKLDRLWDKLDGKADKPPVR